MTRKEAINHLRHSLSGRVREAYIYGSFARNELHPDSDIDCIAVTETDLPFPVRGCLFDDLRDRLPSLETLVYTPEEFAGLTEDPSPGFWTSVRRDLVRIV
jgi:predicted nucleotidyltransferase